MTLGIIAAATLLCLALRTTLEPPNLIMIFLLGVTAVASQYGWKESVLASLLAVAAFDFLFVPPYYTLGVHEVQYFLTFAIMLMVALLISGMAIRLRQQAALWQAREEKTAALYRLSRDMAKSLGAQDLVTIAAEEMRLLFDADVCVVGKEGCNDLSVLHSSESNFESAGNDRAAAAWVAESRKNGGRGTSNFADATGLYVPLLGARGVVGVLGVRAKGSLNPDREALLLTFANNLATALERTILASESQEAKLSAEAEQMRNVLLNSVSHDLRTPLTVIAGAAGAIADGVGEPKELASTIVEQSERLNRHVQNLLDITRFEQRTIEPKLEWHSLEELIGGALQDVEHLLEDRPVHTAIESELGLVKVDGTLLTKALVNLLQNAARYTPEGSEISVEASRTGDGVMICVADRGPGIASGEEERIFDKFYQPASAKGDLGFGLGLAICKSVAEMHKGRVWFEQRSGGGSRFCLEIPSVGKPPEVPVG